MHGVVVLHPAIDEGECGSGIRDRADPDIVALESFDEGLGPAVALRAFEGPFHTFSPLAELSEKVSIGDFTLPGVAIALGLSAARR